MLSQQSLETLKKLVLRKIELMQQRDSLRSVVANGKEFFYKYARTGDGKLLGDGAQRMIEVIQEIEKVESEIKNADTLILVTLEMELGEIGFKFTVPQHPNGAGDVIPSTDVFLSNVEEPAEKNVLNTEDLWTIILLKEMFDVNNIEVVPRGRREN